MTTTKKIGENLHKVGGDWVKGYTTYSTTLAVRSFFESQCKKKFQHVRSCTHIQLFYIEFSTSPMLCVCVCVDSSSPKEGENIKIRIGVATKLVA
jgi:hypothetical protein